MRPPERRRDTATPDPEAIAIQALTFLAGDPERLGRFLGLTGIDPARLRIVAREPHFLASVLGYLMQDESLLLAYAAETGRHPDGIAAAHRQLDRAPTAPTME